MGAEAAQQERRFDGTLRREIDVTTRAIDPEARSIEVVASTDSLDAHGDILEQDWDLKRYKKNPVVLWHHNMFESSPYSLGGAVNPDDLLPIGKAENVRVTEDGLEAKIVFSKANPRGQLIFDMMREGTLRAVSVGFKPGKITEELKEGRKIFRLADNELREISVVPVPSNPDAVAKTIAWEREHLARMAGNSTAEAEESIMAMTEQEKSIFDAAVKRVPEVEAELKAEKAATAKLETELKAASERATKAEEELIGVAIDQLVGKKIVPAEKDEYVQLAKDIGLERVRKMLANRPDLKLLESVKVAGQELTSVEQTAPAPAEAGDGSADIVKSALAAANAA